MRYFEKRNLRMYKLSSQHSITFVQIQIYCINILQAQGLVNFLMLLSEFPNFFFQNLCTTFIDCKTCFMVIGNLQIVDIVIQWGTLCPSLIFRCNLFLYISSLEPNDHKNYGCQSFQRSWVELSDDVISHGQLIFSPPNHDVLYTFQRKI